MKALIAAILLVASSIAVAAPGASAGTASINDVTLAGQKANSFVWSTGNAQSGPNGDSSLFSSSFGGGTWDLLGKVDSTGALSGSTNPVLGSNLTLSFSLASGSKTGTWTITSSKSLQMDLVLGIHAGNATGSFLFDNLVLTAGQTQSGTFAINWKNNGGQIPAFSNVTLFTSNAALRNVAAVPEPSAYAMLLAGLAVVGWMAMRRRSKFAAAAPLAAA
ncbi:PEP-CTERM sorting domain-containing protein [Herbaspirillum huttiense]|uniref:PEP-CTERM sorting domain-containing protein n=2 Tax=Herbaspirillum huttiense TaxID=863372 RepID=A0AAJ2HDQ1_9BURK|nr:PEP-CTERM sorting domain-containing protein [Herbaspirillum huttiense]MDR9838526.1 PEP-CTERM sorting domain-containing protein [Herbaspirillum huttiense]